MINSRIGNDAHGNPINYNYNDEDEDEDDYDDNYIDEVEVRQEASNAMVMGALCGGAAGAWAGWQATHNIAVAVLLGGFGTIGGMLAGVIFVSKLHND